MFQIKIKMLLAHFELLMHRKLWLPVLAKPSVYLIYLTYLLYLIYIYF